ncbi:uncharacterized protein LOC125682172 [Ostrea edulis]|uniref:uncharacterized protein LOC125682172 n=1 Tax=Ostrea edulis TaxID=37623 RepID=UPI0024AEE8C2|nr:uncharacterized protein LOC125682172 [Ostrea edulis]
MTKVGTETLPSRDDDSSPVVPVIITLLVLLVIVAVIVFILYKSNMFGVGDWIDKHIINRSRGNREEQEMEGERKPLAQVQGTGTPQQRKRDVKAVMHLYCGTDLFLSTGGAEKESDKKLRAVKKLHSLFLFMKEIPKKCDINIDKLVLDIRFLYEKSFADLDEDQLQSLRNGEFQTLPSSTVYTIVTNLCNFEKPTRGWDNPPLTNDTKLNDYIARIRSLWNDMCDGNIDVEMIEITHQKMRDSFGEVCVADEEDISREKKEKIIWKQLKPDCEVDGEVVLTEKVKEILEKLTDEGVAVCNGVIGSGKSMAMKYIAEKYIKDGWKVVWREKSLCSTDIEVNQDEKLLLCCDNMFGGVLYECLASKELENIKGLLDNILQSSKTGEVKLLLSVQSHVLKELNKERCVSTVLGNFNYRVDMDKLTTVELYLIFKETIKKGCKSHPKCWYTKTDFSNVQPLLKNNVGLVGNPFLLWAFAMNHAFFTDKKFPENPVKVLVPTFDRLKTEEPKSFYILTYLLFVNKHQKGTALKKWAQELPTCTSIEREEVEEIGADTIASYLHSEKDTIRISHEIFQIALFQSVSKTRDGLDLMLKFCELESILSICRPDLEDAFEDFSVKLKEKDVKILESRDRYRDLILKSNHPFQGFLKPEETLSD